MLSLRTANERPTLPNPALHNIEQGISEKLSVKDKMIRIGYGSFLVGTTVIGGYLGNSLVESMDDNEQEIIAHNAVVDECIAAPTDEMIVCASSLVRLFKPDDHLSINNYTVNDTGLVLVDASYDTDAVVEILKSVYKSPGFEPENKLYNAAGITVGAMAGLLAGILLIFSAHSIKSGGLKRLGSTLNLALTR